jgi:hypothetical protein
MPIPIGIPLSKKKISGENDILATLADNYLVNPGLLMTEEDIKEQLEVTDDEMRMYLTVFEKRKVVGL